MHISELEARLASAQASLRKRLESLRAPHGEAARAEYRAAYTEPLAAERALALAKGEETALPCEWAVRWDMGAPHPMVIAAGPKTYLLYLVSVPNPAWDGTWVQVIDPASPEAEKIALVEFIGCHAFTFGGPNDEVMHGHPLYGKGLESYGAHLVANSRWLAAQHAMDAVHHRHKPCHWGNVKHYLLLFHDDMFECLAEGHRIELLEGSFSEVLDLARRRLLET